MGGAGEAGGEEGGEEEEEEVEEEGQEEVEEAGQEEGEDGEAVCRDTPGAPPREGSYCWLLVLSSGPTRSVA